MIVTLHIIIIIIMVVSLTTAEIDYEVAITPTDLQWLGTLLVLPQDGEVRIRKEYRQMSDEEREEFHNAVNLLKNDKNVTLNKFDILGNVHARWSTAAAAHNGPGFLGWHRVFLLMMENALRQKSENVTIPYWDTTLDDGMSKPYFSVIWSDNFMGTGGGVVKKGPFKNWVTPHGLGKLRRMIYAQGKLMNPKDIKRIMKKRHLNDISFPNANLKNNIEEIHNRAHQWVGGQMRKIEHSAYDPSFYVLHSFVDMLWEQFRNLQKQDGVDPNMDYPKDYGIASHSPLAPMGLGKLVVMDGLSDIWSEGIQYSKRPQCNATHPDCGSKYLKCNVKRSRCISYTYQEYNKNEKSEKEKSEKSENKTLEKSEKEKLEKSEKKKSQKSEKTKPKTPIDKTILSSVLTALNKKELSGPNSSLSVKSDVNDVIQNDASIEGLMGTKIGSENPVTPKISDTVDSPPTERQHEHDLHKNNQSELQHNHSVQMYNDSEHHQGAHDHIAHVHNHSTHNHRENAHNHSAHDHIAHGHNHSTHDHRAHGHNHSTHDHIAHGHNHSTHDHIAHGHNHRTHDHRAHGQNHNTHDHIAHGHNHSTHDHGAHGHNHNTHDHIEHEHNSSLHEHNHILHEHNHSSHGHIHNGHERNQSDLDLLKSNPSEHNNNVTIHEHNHSVHDQSVSMETKTRLPSIFERFGLRWWLFKQKEENYELNPINFWSVVTRLNSKSPMSNLLNTFKKPKTEKTDSTSQLKVLKPVVNKGSRPNVHTITECSNSSAVTMTTQSYVFVILTSLFIFFSW